MWAKVFSIPEPLGAGTSQSHIVATELHPPGPFKGGLRIKLKRCHSSTMQGAYFPEATPKTLGLATCWDLLNRLVKHKEFLRA